MTAADDYITHLNFCYRDDQRQKFKRGELGLLWTKQYPHLFDEDDRRLYETQCDLGFHFYEWLAAILLYESTGYLSLIEKYGSDNHTRKLALWEKLAPSGIRNLPCDKGWPDLFAFSPDHRDWFFCEAKAADKLSDAQRACFRAIHAASGKKVHVLQFNKLD